MKDDRPGTGPERLVLRASPVADGAPGRAVQAGLDPGLDIWNLRETGDWLEFDAVLPGLPHGRGYRRRVAGGPILAASEAAFHGLFALGGPRAAMGEDRPARFPHHIFCADDDIGTAGMAGQQRAASTSGLAQPRTLSAPALVAETLLGWAVDRQGALPLIYARSETDSSATAGALASGQALENLAIAVANWRAAAAQSGAPAHLLGVLLDFALECLSATPGDYAAGMRATLDALRSSAFAQMHRAPRVLAVFESGTQVLCDAAPIHGQWLLALDHGDHDLSYYAPGYMFALDDTGWLSPQGRSDRAEMAAAALVTPDWSCPMIHLAEWDGTVIRAICQSDSALVIDAADPFDAGPGAGFHLLGETGGAEITGVRIDPKDARTVLIKLSAPPRGPVRLGYACGAAADGSRSYPANCGAVRDGWQMRARHGGMLHRWALPCDLAVTGIQGTGIQGTGFQGTGFQGMGL